MIYITALFSSSFSQNGRPLLDAAWLYFERDNSDVKNPNTKKRITCSGQNDSSIDTI